MRTKRFLSLVLAVAMLSAMAISASAAETSKIYLTDDFEESVYKNADTLKAAAGLGTFDEDGKFVFEGFDVDGDPNTNDILSSSNSVDTYGRYWEKHSASNPGTAVTPERLREVGAGYYLTAWNVPGVWGYGTNSLGHNALYVRMGTVYTGTNYRAWLYRILPERWEAEPDEALVFSAEIEPIQTTHTVETNITPGTGALYQFQTSTVVNGVATKMDSKGLNYTFNVTHPVDEETGATGTSWTVILGGREIPASACNQVYNYSTVMRYVDGSTLSWQNYADGVALEDAATVTANAIESYRFQANHTWSYKASKAKLYSLSTAAGAFNVARTGSGLVPVKTVSMPVKFSQPVEVSTYDEDAVTITGVSGDEEITLVNGKDFEVAPVTEVIDGNEIYSTTSITFLKDLKEAADYTITFPGTVKNTAAVELNGYNKISFSTPTPDITIGSFSIVKGWGTDAETTVDEFTADSTLQGASLEIKNNTEAAKNVAVIYAVYASNGQLADVVYSNGSLAANKTASVDAGVKLTATGTVKAFVWDGISSLKPHADATVKTIK